MLPFSRFFRESYNNARSDAYRIPLLLTLLFCLSIRLVTLEYPDLIDPTESRYAVIAQEMVLTGDWLTPRLPWQGTFEPYLGKPPLHFWNTALAMEVFGMDEWATRLPSFLALLTMILALLSLLRIGSFRAFTQESTLILCSTTLMFFMSGASIIDMTLAGCTTCAAVSLLHILFGEKQQKLWLVILGISVGLGFLTKGPIAPAIFCVTLGFYILASKQWNLIWRTEWVWAALCALLVIAPWLYFANEAQPDFIRYFIVNENIKRYLFSEYGDRYGNGHSYPRGTIWLFLIPALLPWLLFIVHKVKAVTAPKKNLSELQRNHPMLFVFCWALAPLFIFTFARQIHAGYLTPAFPALALIIAHSIRVETKQFHTLLFKTLPWILFITSVGIFVFGALWGIESGMFLILAGLLILAFLSFLLRHYFDAIPLLSVQIVLAFATGLVALTHGLSVRRSVESIVRCITHNSLNESSLVGLFDASSYSLYYYRNAWREELPKIFDIRYIDPSQLDQPLPPDIILRTKDMDDLMPTLGQRYRLISSFGRWAWVRSQDMPVDTANCPGDK
jgi:4-amino-4-deoxy-L-arabinose transferase-like glycosyltransferase